MLWTVLTHNSQAFIIESLHVSTACQLNFSCLLMPFGGGRYMKRACNECLEIMKRSRVGEGDLLVELDGADVAVVHQHVGSLGVLYIPVEEFHAALLRAELAGVADLAV